MILTLPTADMSPWQARKRLVHIEKVATKHVLAQMLDGRVDVESDPRLAGVATALKISLPALLWRIAKLMEANR